MGKISNVTRNHVLSTDVRTYASSFAKGIGLMFRLRAPSFAVVFPFNSPRRVAIHMFFVFFPLDIVWLCDGMVVDYKTLRPWTMYSPKSKADTVLELPVGTLERSKTVTGDCVKLA